MADDEVRNRAIEEWRKKIVAHKEVESKVRALRDDVKEAKKEYDKTEDDLKALQSVGQIIGEVLRQLDEERCECGLTGAGRSGPYSCPITGRPWERGPAAARRRRHLPPCAANAQAATTRCSNGPACRSNPSRTALPVPCSHCQVEQRAAVCGGLPLQGGQEQADAQHARGPGCHNPHHHAHPAAGGGPGGVQHDTGGVGGRER